MPDGRVDSAGHKGGSAVPRENERTRDWHKLGKGCALRVRESARTEKKRRVKAVEGTS